jgi:hypothetical protein
MVDAQNRHRRYQNDDIRSHFSRKLYGINCHQYVDSEAFRI